jgi:hypothetical protein
LSFRGIFAWAEGVVLLGVLNYSEISRTRKNENVGGRINLPWVFCQWVVFSFALGDLLRLGVDYLCLGIVYLRGFSYCYWAFLTQGAFLLSADFLFFYTLGV